MTQPGLAACVFLGKLAMGTNVRSSAVSASGRYRLLVSTPTNTISPASGSGAKSTKSWRRRPASIWPSSSASYRLAQLRSKNGENDNSGKLLAAASLESASTRVTKTTDKYPRYNALLQRIQWHGKHIGKHKGKHGELSQRFLRSVKNFLKNALALFLISNKVSTHLRASN